MKIVALLCFYDENPAWLTAAVTSCARFCDHVIASDGGYLHFPGARPHSGLGAHEAIMSAAYGAGIGCTMHAPNTVWYGNEVEKRNHLVQLALSITSDDDWLLWMDADWVVTDCPHDLRDRLAASEHDVGAVTVWYRSVLAGSGASEELVREFDTQDTQRGMRFLLRALRGLEVRGAHYRYMVGGRAFRGPGEEPAGDFSDLRIEHRHDQRPRERTRRADEYNLRSQRLGLEYIEEAVPA